MKKKNGFTLLELLVTIILIISVLGIAIVSVMKLSEKHKENEYERVKQQVQDAAEQFFISNEYIFETLDEESVGIISVKELVEEDYINKVVDPRNNKPINGCNQVKVKRKNGKFYLEYIENNSVKCESNFIKFKVVEPGAPEITLDINGTKGLNDWYTSSVSINVNAGIKGQGNIIKIGKCINLNCTDYDKNIYGEFKNSITDNQTYLNDTNYIESAYMSENEFGYKSVVYVKIKVDKTAPVMSGITRPNYDKICDSNGKCTYYSHKINVNDSLSGLTNKYYYNHCYDAATSGERYCGDFKTGFVNAQTVVYAKGYASRNFNWDTIQRYGHPNGVGVKEDGSLGGENWYHLFYKFEDEAGNVSYYRYKLQYSPSGKKNYVELVGKK